MKKSKNEKKLEREEKKKIKIENKKKIDKMTVATKIIAALMAIMMILAVGASFMYYLIRMFR